MTGDPRTQILFPIFAMFFLTGLVLLRLRSMRFAAIRNKEISAEFYRDYPEGQEPEALRVVSRHYINLFEMPLLFYVGVILTYVTNQVNYWMIGLAWGYVVLRYLHSLVHLTSNNVPVRFSLYFASTFVLLVLWVSLLIRLL